MSKNCEKYLPRLFFALIALLALLCGGAGHQVTAEEKKLQSCAADVLPRDAAVANGGLQRLAKSNPQWLLELASEAR